MAQNVLGMLPVAYKHSKCNYCHNELFSVCALCGICNLGVTDPCLGEF